MRMLRVLLLASVASAWSGSALAADALKQGPAPAWVHPQALPPPKTTDAPVQLLLDDEQVSVEPGKATTYREAAMRIENSQGLAAAGNLALVWQPETDTITLNKLQIIRAGKTIDVLAGGQTFTVLRRETNLDAATLDGTLTATIQPEGLQDGDILVLATTTERSDPVMRGHVESAFAAWGGVPIRLAHASIRWPASLHLELKQTPNLPTAQRSTTSGFTTVDLSGHDVQPLVLPDGAPERFRIGRLAEATDFRSWSDLANLVMPLFRTAEAIPSSGPLHDEVEKLRTASADPKTRAAQALALVQDRVRYVALLMGEGGYVPATAEQTWSRRFGDCKAKTALLLGILHSLGIAAEPVLVQAPDGDMVADRLPMIRLFNHVLVRAHIGGKDYWLDGTRSGDTDLDGIQTPDFGWGLPLVQNAQLVRLMPQPYDVPRLERRVSIDASGGVIAPTPITIAETYRGDTAVQLNKVYSALTADQRNEAIRGKAKDYFDGFTVGSSSAAFDKAKRVFDLTIKGTAKLSWKDGWFSVPTASIAFDPDFDRAPGPLHDAPFAVSYPRFIRDQATLRLPAGFAAAQKLSTPVKETLAGVEYARTETVNGDVLTVDSSERAIAPEVTYKDAIAAAPRLRALDNDDLYLKLPERYAGTDADLEAAQAVTPASAQDYFLRAYMLERHSKFDQAKADLDAGLALDPTNAWALKERVQIDVSRQHFDEARKNLQKAEAADPGSADLLAQRGSLAMGQGDLPGALAAFDQALARDPKNNSARLGRASILLFQDKDDEALAEINSFVAAAPHNGAALGLRARILEGRRDLAGADRDIAAALKAEPDNAAVLTDRAMIAVDRSDFATAEAFVLKALAVDPNNSFARNLQSELVKRTGNSPAAMASLDAAVASAPRDPAPLINRAAAHLNAKEFTAAEKDIAAALSLDPGNRRALEVRAQVAGDKGDFAGEVETLTAILKASPSDASVLADRADAYRSLHKLDLALADTNAAMNTGFKTPQLRLLKINILIEKGDMAAVAPEADALVAENPKSDFAMVAAGKVYAALGQRDKAMASFDRALALAPYAYIYINRAQVRPHADFKDKLADLDAALKLEPDNDAALAQKAWLLSDAGRGAEAIAIYDQAIKSALDPANLKLWRGIALAKAGRSAEAKAAIAERRAEAKTAADFIDLCRAQASSGVLLEAALLDCRHAVQLDPKFPGIDRNLGLVLLKLGKLKEALAAYDAGLREKSDAEAYMARAIVHQRLGDSAAASADAAKARSLRADIDDLMADKGLKSVDAAPSPVPAAHGRG